MTYQEAAQNLINLYANYVDVCASNDEGWEDYSEEIAIAVEALLIRADNERMIAAQKEYLTNLCGVAPVPCDATIELLKQENAFDNHFKMGDI
jgi:hypothetical protein